MGKFCSNCGTKLKDEDLFCVKCGKAVTNQSSNRGYVSNNTVPIGIGFSDRINHPEVIKEIADREKKGRGCIFIGIPMPFIIYLIVSLVSDEVSTKDALVFGGGISVVLLVLFIFGSFLTNAKRSWDGIVVDKRSKDKSRRMRDGEIQYYTQYTIYFRTDRGKKEYCVTSSNGAPDYRDYFDYLNVGDRVRYYPHLSFHYEKYDKTHDSEIPCMFCNTMNDILNDRCETCNNLLFK